MCGIAGFNRAEGRSSIPNGRSFAIALAIGIESRGKDATGFAWAEADDHANVWYSKKQGKATRVAPAAPLPRQGIRNLAAHTRYLTLGGAEDNNNNHPVVLDHITAVHNGRVDNHEELIALAGAERIGQVDSFAIPALLARAEELGADHPKELLELIHGVAAISWLDASDPEVLHLARLSTRPLTIGWTKKGDLVFSSTRGTMRKAETLGKVAVEDVLDVPEGTYMRIRNGQFEEWSDFKVNHPKVTQLDMDMPGAKKGKGKSAKGKARKQRKQQNVVPATVSYDPQYTANLDGFDAWEDQIDWDSLVPRRGWKAGDMLDDLDWPPADLVTDADGNWPPAEPSDDELWEALANES